MASYKIAAPDEYLAITGMGVKTLKITKAAWVWPFQRCMRFSVQPHDYAMSLQAMTKEKLQFLLPVVFTVGPDVNQRGANIRMFHDEPGKPSNEDDVATAVSDSAVRREDRGDALMKFAMLLADSGRDKGPNNHDFLEGIVKGIIEGEVRVLVSAMTMEEIFSEREVFKRRIFRNIQSELDQFGLKIYNANVKELKDAPGSTYFASLSQKAHEGATNQARIDVAEAQLRGNVGTQKRKGEEAREVAKIQGEQDRELAKIQAETQVQKTERDIEKATAEAVLKTRKVELDRDVQIAGIQAARKTEAEDEDLKREVQIKRAAAEMERLRATDVVKASIAREAKQQAADAKAYEIEKEARANFEKDKQATEATAYKTKVGADAQAYAAIKLADAELQQKLRAAEGMSAMAEAYAKMSHAFGGPQGLLQYMMIEKGTYVELAKANAEAIRGLQPKISVWNTGAEAGSSGGAGEQQSSMATMRNIYQMLPPLMTTINEQTGITLPEWQFGRMAGQMSEVERRGQASNGQKE
ncbi:hypothetical protein NEUTE1DRAFT_68137 [Neurospora tetrasperma FGSC 2508]|uniref:Band 7 domain-containing protein n=1 Tax=Neurospora tetrasperma (strain FGSC 2508 / ATCC MYA-4615 / P0657) TaxID=510951 RepID=F8MT36_NEUT8|nr:uncharacterized protein NEUTE1DRAFT_68137 [Neurospora tetrasperma FGSC 2508]EGO56018.1 hypothetical protein NEUTE1DRAFT_68137 [Neurospora tetrasperma FGSC 2508]EGZ68714.1 hypothetical protein NEUTE2DRAFT_93142 [Neurospora tetrasperma FGSC 2509]